MGNETHTADQEYPGADPDTSSASWWGSLGEPSSSSSQEESK